MRHLLLAFLLSGSPAFARADAKTSPRDHVRVELCTDGVPTTNVWPKEALTASETIRETHVGFFELPQRYTDDGVRDDRPHPLLLRAAATVNLPPGRHRLLLRGRGASRLFVDDKLVLSTPFPPTDSSGHSSVKKPDSYLDLGPDFRFAPPGNREVWQPFTATGEHRVVLETLVGNYLGKNKRRPELGETVVAISLAGQESWQLLTPTNRVVPYTDAGWQQYAAERAADYDKANATSRAAKRAEHAEYWTRRRDAAKDWLKQSPEVAVPTGTRSTPILTPIDAFLAKAVDEAIVLKAAAKNTTVDYFRDVKPILEAKCYGCHVGENAKGDLRLDVRNPAIVPHKPGESELLTRVQSHAQDRMPPKGDALTAAQIRTLETWIREGAIWPDRDITHTTVTGLCDDTTFLRRAYLDTVGVVPTLAEIQSFQSNPSPKKREELIDRLLTDRRWADHWMAYWQDVLAENPNLINPTLNNSGPFRWWLLEALRDNLPMDRFVTQLVRMKGSERYGGPAGFAVASQNDSPFAAKGTILAGAFLGVEMKCARCHDAPAHRSKQEELFQIAAMLNQKPLKLPATSSVPLDKLHDGGRQPLIRVTLKPGTEVKVAWPFEQFVPAKLGATLAEYPQDSRDVLAALVTAPQNERFARVMANRLWQRLMGRGLVEPVDDWEKGQPSHPELLNWLGRELVRVQYDFKKLARVILLSHAYQRASDPTLHDTPVLFTAPARRRLPAETIVDSLFVATGKPFDVGEVSLDVDGIREQSNSLSLGWAKRSWMLTSTSNERDRPSLSLPRITAVTDVLTAYGWRGARQDPTSQRDHDANVLQPAILANGVMGTWLTRLSDDHGFTPLAASAGNPAELVDAMFQRVLTRKPTAAERAKMADYLAYGFDTRLRTPTERKPPHRPVPFVTWSNHLDPKASEIRIAEDAELRQGPPPSDRFDPAWRTRLENVTWALLNSPDFVFRP